ncbi:dehydrogenase E1 component family protein [Mycobacterium xenopi 3993]|nr:dehydrogenase E1 component family protein [Mycobacterium xenopi 3993]
MAVSLREDDQLVTTYRGLHDLIGKGVPLEEIYGEMMGRTVGASRGKGGTMHIANPGRGVMLSTGIVGAGPPVGVGLAMAAKRKGSTGSPRSASATAPPTPARSTKQPTWPRCGTFRWCLCARTTATPR